MGLLYNSVSISFSVYLDNFLSGSNKRELMIRLFQPQLSTAYSGNRIAPSFKDLDLSKNLLRSASSLRPRPLHSGHIPFGSLNEKAFAQPAYGLPTRENKRRSRVAISVTVPTV